MIFPSQSIFLVLFYDLSLTCLEFILAYEVRYVSADYSSYEYPVSPAALTIPSPGSEHWRNQM